MRSYGALAGQPLPGLTRVTHITAQSELTEIKALTERVKSRQTLARFLLALQARGSRYSTPERDHDTE